MTPLWQDLRYGLRGLRKNPTFAAVAILSLALGRWQVLGLVRREAISVVLLCFLLGIALPRSLGRLLASAVDQLPAFDAVAHTLATAGLPLRACSHMCPPAA